ncbi:MAG: ribosome biogenesis GTPase Der [Alphaproteobacteria bacterium]|nr:ribosome biogenesis GTPase Der [Alphaproteobacteria bacterium]
MTFTLAIAGRPNVGKSTLFNRLIGKAMALVHDTPGVTRDWREGEGELFDLRFRLYDTAGLENRRPKGSMAERTAARTNEALAKCDVILLMVDGREGLTNDDKTVAREIRKTGKPVILLVNKCEADRLPHGFDEASALGFENILPVSATHGEGLAELYEALLPYMRGDIPPPSRGRSGGGGDSLAETSGFDLQLSPRSLSPLPNPPLKGEGIPSRLPCESDSTEEDSEEPKRLHLAIVGRPNAGKSTLVNRLIGEERLLTGPEPGLTRDAIHVEWEYKGQSIRLVDTAGLRRRARIEEKLEKMSAQETLRAIRLAHVVVLVLDAEQPFDKQDYTIAQHVVEEGRALVIAVNKWDAVKEKTAVSRMIRAKIEASLAQVAGVPLVPISALKGEGLDKLMREITRLYEVWNKRVSTGQLNRWLEGMEADHPPPIVSGRRVKLRYMTQVKSRPPTFALWVNKPVGLPESYVRFLTGGLRKTFGLEGVPIRWLLKKGENPYEGKKTKR